MPEKERILRQATSLIDRPRGFVVKFGPLSRAVNSAVECHLHTVEVTGSIPVPPTNRSPRKGAEPIGSAKASFETPLSTAFVGHLWLKTAVDAGRGGMGNF